ncbi:MAG TPA: PKD domain-containing protein [Sedimentisphaerales bacterium]|nr:PKD domain-containing protein [Sedimentisphaerales bacterium]
MNRTQKRVVYLLIALTIFAETVLADRNDTLNRMIKKYSEQEIVCLDIDEEYPFKLKDGSEKVIRLISVREYRDNVLGQIRQADVNVRVNGKLMQLVCAPYTMPTEIDGIRIQVDTTSAWLPLPKRVQLSVWDANDTIVHTERLGFPIRDYLLFSQGIQAYNEVVHLGWKDGCPEGVSFHHNYGIDFAGYEGKEQIISSTDGEVIRLSSNREHIFVVIQDDDGLIWEYGHLDSISSEVKKGERISRGQKIGVLGKTGPSGNFSHLHLGTYLSKADLDAGRNNRRLNLYPWLIAAYQRQYPKTLYAIARPHQTVPTGEKVIFDASRSLSFGTRIVSYKWVFSDGQTINGVKAEKKFDEPGVYIATLWVKDEEGTQDVDFAKVKVFTESSPEGGIPTIFMTHTPTNNVLVDQPVLFRFWLQGAEGKPIKVDFGDGTIIDHYASYSEVRHRFKSRGIHIVTASGTVDGKPIMQKRKVIVGQDKL